MDMYLSLSEIIKPLSDGEFVSLNLISGRCMVSSLFLHEFDDIFVQFVVLYCTIKSMRLTFTIHDKCDGFCS